MKVDLSSFINFDAWVAIHTPAPHKKNILTSIQNGSHIQKTSDVQNSYTSIPKALSIQLCKTNYFFTLGDPVIYLTVPSKIGNKTYRLGIPSKIGNSAYLDMIATYIVLWDMIIYVIRTVWCIGMLMNPRRLWHM